MTLPALFKAQVWVNPDSEVFGDPAARDALQAEIDKEALTEEALGDRGEVSTEALPAGMLPDGAAPATMSLMPMRRSRMRLLVRNRHRWSSAGTRTQQ